MKNDKFSFRELSAAFMLVSGVALSVAGFCVQPVGEVSDSVLWFTAQCLVYAGSAIGIDVVIDRKIGNLRNERKEGVSK